MNKELIYEIPFFGPVKLVTREELPQLEYMSKHRLQLFYIYDWYHCVCQDSSYRPYAQIPDITYTPMNVFGFKKSHKHRHKKKIAKKILKGTTFPKGVDRYLSFNL